MKRGLAIGLAAIALVVLGGLFLLWRGATRSLPAAALERSALVESGDIDVWISGTGTIQPAALASLSFKVSGNIGSIDVQIGEQVSGGQRLMELDPASLDPGLIGAQADVIAAREQLQALLDFPTAQQLAQAQLAVAQARDALEDAQYRWRVQQEGFRANPDTVDAAEARLVLAEEQVEAAEAAYDQLSGLPADNPARAVALTNLVNARQARDSALRSLNWYTGRPSDIEQAILDAEVAMAEANLKDAQETLAELEDGPDPDDLAAAEARLAAAQAIADQARLVAPFDGTVLAVSYRVGDTVVPGQPGIVIADLSKLHVDTLIDELDIAMIERGQPVEITLDALPELVLSGLVAQIDLAPASGTGGTDFPVMVELSDSHEAVRVGMTAAINILVAHEEQVLLVPNWALRFDADSGEIYVTVIGAGGLSERVPITLGLRNDQQSQVLGGLSPGDTVGIVETPAAIEFQGPFGGG